MRSLLILLGLIILSDLIGITQNIDVRDLAVLYYFFRCMYLENSYQNMLIKLEKYKEDLNGNDK